MNIIMASDDNYARIMAASINSMTKNNTEAMKIYIIDDGISDYNKRKILEIISRYDRLEIIFIDFEIYKKQIRKLVKSTNPPLPLITYARLFIAEMIPDDRILYVDCDTICCANLCDLWNIDMTGKIIAGVWDTVDENVKKIIGLNKNDKYINAGIIMINLKKWREDNCTNRAIEFINQNDGCVMHNDQGVINALFKNEIKIVSPKYNAMTPMFLFSRNKILKYFNLKDYYLRDELLDAKKNPVFIHFVRFTTSRPWEEKCCHPLKEEFIKNYIEVYGEMPEFKSYNISNGQKMIFNILNHYPFFVYKLLIKILYIRNKLEDK